jgi:hypothetical protein
MLTLDQPAERETARQYIASHDSRARALSRMIRPKLAQIWWNLHPGAWTVTPVTSWGKDELINAVMTAEYPDINAARAVYYATAGKDHR